MMLQRLFRRFVCPVIVLFAVPVFTLEVGAQSLNNQGFNNRPDSLTEIAQLEEMDARLLQLEAQLKQIFIDIRDLRHNRSHVSTNSGASENSGLSSEPSDAAEFRLRLGQIEESLRLLTGEVDMMKRTVLGLEERYEKFMSDVEYRFQALEARGLSSQQQNSEVPQIIGTIQTPVPVETQESDTTEQDPLVGEVVGESNQGIELAGAIDNLSADTPQALYDRARAALSKREYKKAATDFTSFLELYETHELAGHAQYWLGEAYYVEQDFKRAAEAFLAGVQNYGNGAKAPDSFLKLGITLLALGNKDDGCMTLQQLPTRFPNVKQNILQRSEIERRRAQCP